MVVHPSTKLLTAWYVLAAALAAGIVVIERMQPRGAYTWIYWSLILPALVVAYAVALHVQRCYTRLTVEGHRLRFESGIFSRSTRNMELRKVQDIRVDQTFFERVLAIGDMSIETAGETSRLTIPRIDHPQEVADAILSAAHQLFEEDKRTGGAQGADSRQI